jgi:hypothetical protein
LSPANPIKLERFNYYSSVPTKFVRPVVLQKKIGNSWKTIFSGNTAATGKFRFTVHTGSNDTLRSYSVKTTYKGKSYAAVATAPITVRPVTQSAAVAQPSKGGSLAASAAPSRSGRQLLLQVNADGTWTTVSQAAANGSGKATFPVPAAGSYRVIAAAWNGAPAVTSTTLAASGASPASVTRLDPSNPIKLERFSFYSAVPTQFVRPVQLQKKVGDSWKAIFWGNTAASGKFRFTVHTGSNDTLRAFAPAATYKGVQYGQIGTTPVTVTPVTQSVKLTLPGTASVNKETTATIASTPSRAGRKAVVQVQGNGSWSTVSTGTLSASGTASVKFTPSAAGNFVYRAVVDAWNGAPSLSSAGSALTVSNGSTSGPENYTDAANKATRYIWNNIDSLTGQSSGSLGQELDGYIVLNAVKFNGTTRRTRRRTHSTSCIGTSFRTLQRRTSTAVKERQMRMSAGAPSWRSSSCLPARRRAPHRSSTRI